jgi:uncharacterized protein YbcV (DUF1398 family)
LVSGLADVPPSNRDLLAAALRTDQAGMGRFPGFLASAWRAGVVLYAVDFAARTCTCCGSNEEVYVEEYPAVEV